MAIWILLASLLYIEPPHVLECLPDNGLRSVSGVRALCQDHAGFLWFAGQNGLHRFDGSTFLDFSHNPNDSRSPSHPQINDLAFDGTAIWVATEAGLDRLDPVTGKYERMLQTNRGITKLQVGPQFLWLIGSDSFSAYDTKTQSLHTTQSQDQVRFLGAGEQGLWFQKETSLYLYIYDSGWRHFDLPLPVEEIRFLLQDSNGLLWLAMSEGLTVWNIDSIQPAELAYRESLQATLSQKTILAFFEDRQNRIWISSTEGVWLFNLNFGGLTQISANDSVSCLSNVSHFLDDQPEGMWLGSENGLALYRPGSEPYRNYGPQHGLPDTSINAVLETQEQTVWIASNRGLVRLDTLTNRITPLELKGLLNQLNEPAILQMVGGPDGVLWLASKDHIFALEISNSTFAVDRLASMEIVLCDFNGAMWAADADQLTRCTLTDNQIQVEHFALKRPESGDAAIQAMATIQNQLWIGTRKGLWSLDASGSFLEISDTENLNITSLAPSETGVWLGTKTGLAHYTPGKSLDWVASKSALKIGDIDNLIVDPLQRLWIGGRNGHGIYNSTTHHLWQPILDRRALPRPVRLLANPNADHRRIYLNHANGLAILQADQVESPTFLPPSIRSLDVITRESTHHYIAMPPESLELPEHTQAIVLEFSSSDLMGHLGHFKYRLIGPGQIDRWQKVDRGKLVLVGLERGTYDLHLSRDYSAEVAAEPTSTRVFSFNLQTDMQQTFLYRWWHLIALFLLGSTFLVLARNLQLKQQQLRATQENEAVMDRILANTSHELRTPIHGILGLTQALRDGVAGPLNERAHFNLRLVSQSGQRLATLVDSLLDFAKARQNQMTTLFREPVPLHALVNKIFESMAQSSQVMNKSLQLRNLVPHTLSPVYADPGRLHELLQHLVSNGIKFTQHGFVAIEANEVGDQIEIAVKDTGAGIPDHLKTRIFDAFQQQDNGTTRLHSGLGLGLSICQALAEAHGSKLEVDSVVGEGTCFYFRLAKAEAAPDSRLPNTATNISSRSLIPEESQALPPKAEAAQILIVDDNPINLQVIYNYLEDEYRLAKAFSGREALNYIEAHTLPELVLLDIMMPGMSGFEVCQQLRKSYPAETLPIIFLTARGQLDDKVRGFKSGANDHLIKPVLKEELIARIELQLQLRKTHQLLLKEKQWLEEAVEMEQLKRLNRESELRLLHAQMQPHFLQNTLNSAAYFCVEDPEKAIELLGRLSTLLRQSVTAAPRGWWSLEDEMKTIQAFIDVQHFRFADRLSVETEIDSKALSKEVPCFLIQPLVENAIIHGMRQAGNTQVSLRVRLDQQALQVEVSNTGIPLRQPLESLLSEDHALGNINKRLLLVGSEKLVYQFKNDRHRFSFSIALPEHASRA